MRGAVRQALSRHAEERIDASGQGLGLVVVQHVSGVVQGHALHARHMVESGVELGQ